MEKTEAEAQIEVLIFFADTKIFIFIFIGNYSVVIMPVNHDLYLVSSSYSIHNCFHHDFHHGQDAEKRGLTIVSFDID